MNKVYAVETYVFENGSNKVETSLHAQVVYGTEDKARKHAEEVIAQFAADAATVTSDETYAFSFAGKEDVVGKDRTVRIRIAEYRVEA